MEETVRKYIEKQECIPVGCVPADRRPYAGVCFLAGGSPSRGGVLHPAGGVLHPAGGGLHPARGVLHPAGGVSIQPGGSPCQTPPCEQNDRQV